MLPNEKANTRPKLDWYSNQHKNKPQSNALAAGMISMLVSGIHIGYGIFYPNLIFDEWTSSESNLFINFTISSFYFGIIVGLLIGRTWPYGPKRNIYIITTIVYIITSIMFISAPHVGVVILIARFLVGIAHGVVYLTLIIHGSEIVVNDVRGMLISTIQYCTMLSVFTGVVVMHGIGLTDYSIPRAIGIGCACYSLLGLISIPFFYIESPIYLIQNKKNNEAVAVMQRLRREPQVTWEITMDFQEMNFMIEEDSKLNKIIWSEGNFRPLILVSLSTFVSILSFNLPLNYIRDKFISDGGDRTLLYALILSVRTIAGILSFIFCDRIQRKKIQLVSGCLSGLMLVIIASLYAIISDNTITIMIIGFAVYELVCSLGINSISQVLQSEAFPLPKKANSLVFIGITESLINILLIAFTFEVTISDVFIYVILYGFGILMMVVSLYLYLTLPETRIMSLRQARAEFRKTGGTLYSGQNQPTSIAYAY